MNPKVSILIPVYKASKYIERCAESLFNQTFDDIEYIFVNDATPDDSIEKLEKVKNQFLLRSNQVKLIHNAVNLGVGATRNLAIKASSGDFILFVDSDDYIEPTMIERLYEQAIKESADIVVCDFFLEYADKTILISDYLPEGKKNQLNQLLQFDKSTPALWNKLIKSSLYKREDCLVVDNMNYYEDRFVSTRLYYFAEKIVKVNEPFYHYVQYNLNALTKTIKKMHFENVLLFWNSMDDFFRVQNEFDYFREIMVLPKLQSKVRLMIDTHSSELRKEFAGIFSEEEKQAFNQLKTGEKFMLLLIRYKLFFLAQLYHKLLVLRNKPNSKSKKTNY